MDSDGYPGPWPGFFPFVSNVIRIVIRISGGKGIRTR